MIVVSFFTYRLTQGSTHVRKSFQSEAITDNFHFTLLGHLNLEFSAFRTEPICGLRQCTPRFRHGFCSS
jgi:hypothetical protein